MKTETSTDNNEQSLANNHHPLHQHEAPWLDAEMDELGARGAPQKMQDEGLRPKTSGLADVAAISPRDAMPERQGRRLPAAAYLIDEVPQALKASNQRNGECATRRRLSNWSRGSTQPLKFETLVVAMAPHIDQPSASSSR